jgi:hypothetical protein
MKKSLLAASIATLISFNLYSEEAKIINPAAPQTPPEAPSQLPSAPQPITTAVIPAPSTPEAINCEYKMPQGTTKVDPATLATWVEKAATQSFDFDYNTIDTQLTALKPCFTDQGWLGFNEALQKSGNLNAIRTQQLTVSSMIEAPATIAEAQENQWKVALPLQVVYQNDKEKLTQHLSIEMIVGKKLSGDLGIMQIIATPKTVSPTPAPDVQPATPATVPVAITPTAPPPASPATSPMPATNTPPQ